MKKYTLIIICFFLFCGKKENPLVETPLFNVLKEDFDKYYENQTELYSLPRDLRVKKKIFKDYFSQKIVALLARNQGLDTTAYFKLERRRAQMNIAIGMFKNSLFSKNVDISEEQINGYFQRSLKKYKVKYIRFKEKKELPGVFYTEQGFEKYYKSVLEKKEEEILAGELDYFTFGDMEPFFEDLVRGLQVGEISELTPCRDGYYVVKLMDVVSEPIKTETDFISKKDDLIIKGRLYELQKNFVKKTDSILKKLDYKINPKGISHLLDYFFRKDIENIDAEAVIYEFGGREFDTDDFIDQLRLTYPEDRMWVKDSSDLVKVIKSFIFREHLVNESGKKGIKDTKEYKSELKERERKLLNRMFKETALKGLDEKKAEQKNETEEGILGIEFPVLMTARKIREEIIKDTTLFYKYAKKTKSVRMNVKKARKEVLDSVKTGLYPILRKQGVFYVLKLEKKVKSSEPVNLEKIWMEKRDSIVAVWMTKNECVFYDSLLNLNSMKERGAY